MIKQRLTRPLKDQEADSGHGVLSRGDDVDESQVSVSPLCPPSWPSMDEVIEAQRQQVVLPRSHVSLCSGLDLSRGPQPFLQGISPHKVQPRVPPTMGHSRPCTTWFLVSFIVLVADDIPSWIILGLSFRHRQGNQGPRREGLSGSPSSRMTTALLQRALTSVRPRAGAWPPFPPRNPLLPSQWLCLRHAESQSAWLP